MILGGWLFFAVWVIGGGGWLLKSDADRTSEPSIVLGLPSWVFWIVALPWLLATLFTLVACQWWIRDEPESDDE